MQRFLLILGVCFLGVFLFLRKESSKSVVDVLILENVEALAAMQPTLPTYCRENGNLTCPLYGEKVGVIYEGYSIGPDEESY